MGLFSGIIGNASETDINKVNEEYGKLLGPEERIEKERIAKEIRLNNEY